MKARAIYRDAVRVIKCNAPVGKCAYTKFIGRTGVVVKTDFDHALIRFDDAASDLDTHWFPQFHVEVIR